MTHSLLEALTGRFIEPGTAEVGDAVLTDAQVASWRESGVALVDGVLPEELVDQLRTDAYAAFPAPDAPEAQGITGFGSAFVFPAFPPRAPSAAFNGVTLHPRLLGAVARLLGIPVSDLRLSQSDLWPKYGREPHNAGALDNQDQRIHVDYPNHFLTHPSPWQRPDAVEMILYLSDIEECAGPTAVVPRQGADDACYPWPIVDTPGVGGLHYVNDRASAEAYMARARPQAVALRESLYARERYVRYRPGTILFYRHDAWHRGTPMIPGSLRLAHNLSFRRADAEWISTLHVGWAWALYAREHAMERLIAEASVEQRAVLGFPQPGSAYWCEETLAAVAARYGVFGFDVAPYRAALTAARRDKA